MGEVKISGYGGLVDRCRQKTLLISGVVEDLRDPHITKPQRNAAIKTIEGNLELLDDIFSQALHEALSDESEEIQ